MPISTSLCLQICAFVCKRLWQNSAFRLGSLEPHQGRLFGDAYRSCYIANVRIHTLAAEVSSYVVQTIHVCGRTLEAYNPELSDLVHWNRIRVGYLVMHTGLAT